MPKQSSYIDICILLFLCHNYSIFCNNTTSINLTKSYIGLNSSYLSCNIASMKPTSIISLIIFSNSYFSHSQITYILYID